MCKCMCAEECGGAEEIGTLRFGWLEKVAGRGWELPKTGPRGTRMLET
jgi:hypothetical protein